MPKLGPACLFLVSLLLACQPIHAAPAGEGVPTYHGKTLKQWVDLSRDDDPKVRLRAVVHLGLGPFNKAAVPALRVVLKDKEQKIILAAIHALGQIGHDADAAMDDLVTLMNESDRETRENICSTFGDIGPIAVPVLLDVLKNRFEHTRTRESAIHSLERIGPAAKDAIPALMLELRHSGNPIYPIEALSRIGEPAVPALIEATRCSDPTVQARAVKSLGRIRPVVRDLVPLLVDKLKHADGDVRLAAAETLDDIGPEASGAVEGLAMTLKDPAVQIRLRAAGALRSIGSAAAPAVPALVKVLNDKDEAVSLEAALALARIGKAAVPALGEALSDENTAERAAYALAFVGNDGVRVLANGFQQRDPRLCRKVLHGFAKFLEDMALNLGKDSHASAQECFATIAPDAIQALINALRDNEVSVRQMAIRALRRFPRDADLVLPALARAIMDEDEDVRRLAVEAISRLDPMPEKAAATIAQALTDKSKFVRAEAAFALAGIGGDAKCALPKLALALHDESSVVRSWALKAIGNLGDDAKGLTLSVRTAIEDPDVTVQVDAAVALWRLDPKNELSVPTLVRIINVVRLDPNARHYSAGIVQKAARALEMIGPSARKASPALISALRDEQPIICDAAAKALGRIAAKDDANVLAALGERLLDGRYSADTCAQALGQLGPVALPFLTKGIQSSNPYIRRAALQGFETLGAAAKPSVPALTELLFDPNEGVRRCGAFTLGAIGQAAHPAAPALADAVRDRDTYVRREAATALGAIGSNAHAQSSLEQALKDSDEQVRQEAATALGKWGNDAKSTAPALREACKDANGEVRVKASAALCRVMENKSEGLASLKACLRDKELFVRVLAAEALWDLDHNKDGLPAVLEALKDPSEASYALLVVDKMGSAAKGIVPDLLALIQNKYGRCYYAGIEALKKIDPEAAKKAGVR